MQSLLDDCALPFVILGYSKCYWHHFGAPSRSPQRTPEVASREFRTDLGLHVSLRLRTFSGCRREFGSVREFPHQEETLLTSNSFLTRGAVWGMSHTVSPRVLSRTELQMPRVTPPLPHALPGFMSWWNCFHPVLVSGSARTQHCHLSRSSSAAIAGAADWVECCWTQGIALEDSGLEKKFLKCVHFDRMNLSALSFRKFPTWNAGRGKS